MGKFRSSLLKVTQLILIKPKLNPNCVIPEPELLITVTSDSRQALLNILQKPSGRSAQHSRSHAQNNMLVALP